MLHELCFLLFAQFSVAVELVLGLVTGNVGDAGHCKSLLYFVSIRYLGEFA